MSRLGALWFSQQLSEDEGYRRYGRDRQAHEESEIELERDDYYLRQALALNSSDGPHGDFGFKVRLEEQGIKLKPGSEAWRRLFFEYLKATKRATDVMKARNAGDVVETPAPPTATSAPRACTVDELIAEYLADPTRKRTPGTLKTYQTVFRAMRELLGADTAVDTIHRTDCERIRNVIMRLPKNASQRFRGLSLEEAARIADAEKLERLGVSAVNNYLHNLSALFNWGVDGWRMIRNPAKGLALKDDRNERDLRSPFSTEQLRSIFSAPLYTGCVDDEKGYHRPGPNVIRRGRFWVPLIALWTGMRLGEVCQLRTNDIAAYEGVPVILIDDAGEPGEDEEDRKRIKTAAGKRFVPIHPELERIGLLAFAEHMRSKGESRLFPELAPDSLGYLSGTFSKWFNDKRRFLGKVGVASPGVSFHSFRHNYRDALREAEISLERVKALGGWRRDSEGEESIYGRGLRAATLYGEIKKIHYPGLDLSHLHAAQVSERAA